MHLIYALKKTAGAKCYTLKTSTKKTVLFIAPFFYE